MAGNCLLTEALAHRVATKGPIRIGLLGSGEMGTDIVTAVQLIPGLEISAIADRCPEKPRRALETGNYDSECAIPASSGFAIESVISKGKIALTQDADALACAGGIDVIIDATGRPDVAAIGLKALQHGKHLIMMNVEADVTVGRLLSQAAAQQGCVYTLGAGDEPVATLELVNFVRALGHPVIAAGKGKNNPLKIDAVPSEYENEARRRNMNPRMLVEFVDGSKTMVEMAALANATGLVPDTAGMHGPSAALDELESVFCPKADGGILSRDGVVDYTIGSDVAPGVFCIARFDHPRLIERMSDLRLGPGPYYRFYRPFHLTSLEVPLSAIRAVLEGRADMHPLPYPVAEVTGLAKRSLRPGDTLDSIGETCYRAWTMTAKDAHELRAIPCGLLVNARVTKPVSQGDLLTSDNISIPTDSELVRLRRLQDEQDASLSGKS